MFSDILPPTREAGGVVTTPDDRPDPIYGYVDDKISELKNGLLFNEIADLQEKLDNITKQLLDVKREAALVAIRGCTIPLSIGFNSK